MDSPRQSERVAMGTTPATAYRVAQHRAIRNLRQIEALLATHARRQVRSPGNWGPVGYVRIVADELAALAKSMKRTKREGPR